MTVEDSENKLLQKELIVEYKKGFYNLSDFLGKHPGGRNFLEAKSNRNIDQAFLDAGHSRSAEYLLKEYRVGDKNDSVEDLEQLVDWNKAMIPQITKLDQRYFKWVNLPVDRPLRLFGNDFLESLTKTSWYVPLLFWIPVISFMIFKEVSSSDQPMKMIPTVVTHFACGIFLWTLFEYIFHRYVFHIDTRQNPNTKLFHFLFHGLHHKVPFDQYRLVFPPIPAAIIALIVHQPIRLLYISNIIDHPYLLSASLLTGYLLYDMTHYYIHHGRPSSGYFYNLKRYHHKHHFVNHDLGYGVSNTLWDDVFDTKIQLKRLKYVLRW